MAMTSNQKTAATFFGATILTSIASAAFLLTTGIDDEGISLALRVSGRVAFAVLIVVFAARPLQQLLKSPWTAKLLRNRKLLGVAFAGIHAAHLGLIFMRASHVPDFDVSVRLLGITVYTFIFLMLITSFSGPARAIGPKAWQFVHKIGLFVIFSGFLLTQLPRSFDKLELANGMLTLLAATAIGLRVGAFVRRRQQQPQ